jgi:type IV secretory pathway TraG/TraD family ATPase VirD4
VFIQKDAQNEYQAELIADKLIKDTEDPIWSNGSRLIFVGLIVYLNETHKIWGWDDLAKALILREEDLQSVFQKHYPRAEKLIIAGSKTTQSFFINLIATLGWVFTLAKAWPQSLKKSFSIKNWSTTDSALKTLIVQADKRYKSLSAPVANALISLISAQLLAEPNGTERETWLFLDELANMPKNPYIFDWISLGGSKGCRLVGGTQSISQLQHIFSEKETNTFLGMMNTFVAMRSGSDAEGSKYIATIFGDREIERQHVSRDKNGSKTISLELKTQPMVSATDLMHLPLANKSGAEGFLKIAGYNAVYKLKWPTHLPSI